MKHTLRSSVLGLTILMLTVTFLGCDELISIWTGGGGGSRITSYPMHMGDRWNYNQLYYTYNFRPIDSTYQFQPDTFSSAFTTVVTRQLNIPRVPGAAGDSIVVTEFSSTGTGQQAPGLSYYSQTSDGLRLQGYFRGSLILPTPSGAQYSITLADRSFGSLRELLQHVEEPISRTPPDSMTREYPPLLSIKYPLQAGEQWTFRPNGCPWRIDKRTGAMRNDPVSGLWYHEVRWLYDMNGDGIWDNNISITDRISSKGLIRRTVDVRDILITTSGGPGVVGYVDVRDEYTLISMTVR